MLVRARRLVVALSAARLTDALKRLSRRMAAVAMAGAPLTLVTSPCMIRKAPRRPARPTTLARSCSVVTFSVLTVEL